MFIFLFKLGTLSAKRPVIVLLFIILRPYMKLFSSALFFVAASTITGVAYLKQTSDSFVIADEQNVGVVQSKSYILQGSSPENLQKVVTSVGGNISREFPIINAVSAILTPTQAKQIKELGSVRVQDDRTVRTSSTMSTKRFAWEYDENHLNNEYYKDNYIVKQISANVVHNMGITGDGVTVAVVDSGANMWGINGSYLFRDADRNQRTPFKYNAIDGELTYRFYDDGNGHGTHVSNIIANSLDNSAGEFNGIAPNVNLIPVKAFDDDGASSYSIVLDSLNWIYENHTTYDIRVVNMSLGASVQSYYWLDPINQAVSKLWQAGVVVVSSGGNNGEEMGITVPGNNPYIITVGAVTDSATPYDPSDDRVTSYSAKGPTFEGFIKPDLVAYGNDIETKMDVKYLKKSLKASAKGADYALISGTSQASAMVSGVVALMLSNDPSLTPDDIKCRLKASAKQSYNSSGLPLYGPFEQGAGMVNAYDAVMSTARGCANNGLDIDADLAGEQHFMGPAKVNENGDYYLLSSDGTVLQEGLHWGNSNDLGLEGLHWGNASDLGLEGLHWDNSNDLSLEGLHWGNESEVGLEGLHWSVQGIELKGLHWGTEDLNVQGMHWDGDAMNTQSVQAQSASDLNTTQGSAIDLESIMDEGLWQ